MNGMRNAGAIVHLAGRYTRIALVPMLLLAHGGSRLRAQGAVLVDMRALSPHELRTEGFVLSQPQDVHIRAVGANDRTRDKLKIGPLTINTNDGWDRGYWRGNFSLAKPTEVEIYAIGEVQGNSAYDYGWIINADTRERVWKLDPRRSELAGGASKNRMVREVRTLPAGRYAAIFTTDDSHDPVDWNAAPPYDPDFWGLTIRTKNPADKANAHSYAYEPVPMKDAMVALNGLHDSESRSYGFTVNKPLDVRVYAVGEGRDGQMYDYGWITDAKTHRHVWQMQYDDTDNAGGAEKNRVADRVIHLEKGNYIVGFVTDGSHSYGDWNSAPPMDGEYWGITILPASGTLDRSAISAFDEKAAPNVVAQLVRIRADQERRTRFTLDSEGDVRVYAIGEGTGGDMDDYGWIEDARSGRTVWEMTYTAT